MISIIPIFLPQQSCPHHCIFCNQKAAVGEVQQLSCGDIIKDIESALKTISEDSVIQVGFYGGSFTLLPVELQKAYLDVPAPFIKAGRISGIRISTRTDAIDKESVVFLKDHKVTTVELGVEILDDKILSLIKRGHNCEDVAKAVDLLKPAGLKTGLQLMIGLPGEDEERRRKSFEKVLSLRPDFLRIHPTVVLKGSGLEKMYKEGAFIPMELEEAVKVCADMVISSESIGIPVIRIGLQSSLELQKEGSIIAGPWHPSFGQMVRSEIYYRLAAAGIEIMKQKQFSVEEITAECSDAETFKGQKNSNITRLKNKFPGIVVKTKKNKSILKNQLSLTGSDGKSILVSIADL